MAGQGNPAASIAFISRRRQNPHRSPDAIAGRRRASPDEQHAQTSADAQTSSIPRRQMSSIPRRQRTRRPPRRPAVAPALPPRRRRQNSYRAPDVVAGVPWSSHYHVVARAPAYHPFRHTRTYRSKYIGRLAIASAGVLRSVSRESG